MWSPLLKEVTHWALVSISKTLTPCGICSACQWAIYCSSPSSSRFFGYSLSSPLSFLVWLASAHPYVVALFSCPQWPLIWVDSLPSWNCGMSDRRQQMSFCSITQKPWPCSSQNPLKTLNTITINYSWNYSNIIEAVTNTIVLELKTLLPFREWGHPPSIIAISLHDLQPPNRQGWPPLTIVTPWLVGIPLNCPFLGISWSARLSSDPMTVC